MTTVNTAFKDAEIACFDFLCDILDADPAKGDAGIGNLLPYDTAGVFVFRFGPASNEHNYQRPGQAQQWLAQGLFQGQYASREDAYKVIGAIMDATPPAKNTDNAGHVITNRGLSPNVNVFEITTTPDVYEEELPLLDNNENVMIVTRCDIEFRVQYGVEQN